MQEFELDFTLDYSFSASLTQPIYTGGAVSSSYKISKYYKDIAEADLETTQSNLALAVLVQFYGVLAAREARHHLLRTACGLNSALPGDRDVVAQLQTACRIAQCARTAGARATTIVNEAAALAQAVHAETAWGRFSTGYCAAALARICEVDGVRPDRFHHVVVGGSTTSRSILSTLAEEHGVPHRQMTLVYRDHHGQMRQLRAALGSGRRLRVHAYGEASGRRKALDGRVSQACIREPFRDAVGEGGRQCQQGFWRQFLSADLDQEVPAAGAHDATLAPGTFPCCVRPESASVPLSSIGKPRASRLAK